MKFFHNIYEFSISSMLSHRIIFWGTLTILNAITGHILSMDMSTVALGKILGICTWIIIYVWIVAPRYSVYGHSLFGTSVFWAYSIKTLFILCYPISMLLDFWIWMINLQLITIISEWIPIISNIWEVFQTYILTIMHGLVLSILIFILAYCIYLIRILYSRSRVQL
jgi:hypothetical protein